MLHEKQELLFKELKKIKDVLVRNSESYLRFPVNCSLTEEYKMLSSKLNSEEEIHAFYKVQNELAEDVIYRIMECIDGYGELPFSLDLVDKENNESLRNNIELHDKFMDYLYQIEKQN